MNLFHWRIPFLTILMGKKVNLTVVKHRYNQDFRPRSKLLHFSVTFCAKSFYSRQISFYNLK